MTEDTKPEAEPEVAEKPKKVEKALPSKIKMTMMWGYVDDEGVNRLWQTGQEVDDPDDIRRIIVDCKNKNFKVV